MKLKRTILGPILVALFAFVSGGWLLQRGVDQAGPTDTRILLEVLERISRDYVDEHSSDELYQMAVEGFLKELGDPHTSFMSAAEYQALRPAMGGSPSSRRSRGLRPSGRGCSRATGSSRSKANPLRVGMIRTPSTSCVDAWVSR
jgi:hypothetical protein